MVHTKIDFTKCFNESEINHKNHLKLSLDELLKNSVDKFVETFENDCKQNSVKNQYFILRGYDIDKEIYKYLEKIPKDEIFEIITNLLTEYGFENYKLGTSNTDYCHVCYYISTSDFEGHTRVGFRYDS